MQEVKKGGGYVYQEKTYLVQLNKKEGLGNKNTQTPIDLVLLRITSPINKMID